MELFELKKRVHEACKNTLVERTNMISEEMRKLQISSETETKSSAGDKYETARAMIFQEKEKLMISQSEIQKMIIQINNIKIDKNPGLIATGSLVKTDQKIFFISVSLGQISIGENEIFAISPASPIGQLLIGKKTGQSIQFKNQQMIIQETC